MDIDRKWLVAGAVAAASAAALAYWLVQPVPDDEEPPQRAQPHRQAPPQASRPAVQTARPVQPPPPPQPKALSKEELLDYFSKVRLEYIKRQSEIKRDIAVQRRQFYKTDDQQYRSTVGQGIKMESEAIGQCLDKVAADLGYTKDMMHRGMNIYRQDPDVIKAFQQSTFLKRDDLASEPPESLTPELLLEVLAFQQKLAEEREGQAKNDLELRFLENEIEDEVNMKFSIDENDVISGVIAFKEENEQIKEAFQLLVEATNKIRAQDR